MGILFSPFWNAHPSHRLDPKYQLFKKNARLQVPEHWVRVQIREVMTYQAVKQDFSTTPDKLYRVMTIGQTGKIRDREPGKGNNPLAWRGAYLEEAEGDWFAASAGDVVYSSIDLWKGWAMGPYRQGSSTLAEPSTPCGLAVCPVSFRRATWVRRRRS